MPWAKTLKWLDEYFEEVLLIAMFAALVLLVNAEVFKRYALNSSGVYSEELARYILIWLVYLGVPYAIKHNRHVVCNVLPSSIPRKLSISVNIISYLLFLAFSVLMVYLTYEHVIAQIKINKLTEAMQLPMWYFSIAPGVGFFLACFRLVQSIVLNIRLWNDTDNIEVPGDSLMDQETKEIIIKAEKERVGKEDQGVESWKS